MTKLKQIIFDMDGTLSDTAKATYTAIKQVEKHLDIPPITDAIIRDAMGIAGLDFYRHMYPTVPLETLLKLEPQVDALELSAIQNMKQSVLFPEVVEMLTALKQAGITMYIASTGSKIHVHGTLEAAEIQGFFTEIHCGEPAKISMVQRIVGDADPREWAMVGDMFKDSEAARGSNILAIGAGFGYLADEDYPLFDVVLKTPRELLNYV